MSINAAGIISWTPQQTNSPLQYEITTVVTNSNPYDAQHPKLTAINTFWVNVMESNMAPVLSMIGTQSVAELTPFQYSDAEPSRTSIRPPSATGCSWLRRGCPLTMPAA